MNQNRTSLGVYGSTGSVGRQALDVARRLGTRVRVLTGGQNVDLMEQQAREFQPEAVVLADRDCALELSERLFGTGIIVMAGEEGLEQAASGFQCSVMLSAIMGAAGILPTLAAIKTGCRIALANKETLVAAGSIVLPMAERYGATIIPVDSEHSAIFQCLMASGEGRPVRRVLLTASGGPFFGQTREQLRSVTAERALQHPSWSMGRKITVDSATLMNKGLELIELAVLFRLPADQIEVVIHRESIVHSMVEFEDRSIMAQLSTPDMRIPIQFAMTYPNRLTLEAHSLDFTALGTLTFAKPDEETFRALPLCRRAYAMGGTAPAVLSAANEVAVGLFLAGAIPFLAIDALCEQVLDSVAHIKEPTLERILEADAQAREQAYVISKKFVEDGDS